MRFGRERARVFDVAAHLVHRRQVAQSERLAEGMSERSRERQRLVRAIERGLGLSLAPQTVRGPRAVQHPEVGPGELDVGPVLRGIVGPLRREIEGLRPAEATLKQVRAELHGGRHEAQRGRFDALHGRGDRRNHRVHAAKVCADLAEEQRVQESGRSLLGVPHGPTELEDASVDALEGGCSPSPVTRMAAASAI